MAHSSIQLGRNDPCYCGSGKKFKKCCLNKPLNPEETLQAGLNKAAEQLRTRIMEFGFRNFGRQIENAWEEFNFGDSEGPFDPHSPENSIFVPFFLFLWDPAAPDPDIAKNLRGGIVAKNFLLEHSSHLTETEREILRLYMTQPISFYEILSVQPEKGFTAREILTGGKMEVREQLATRDLQTGDILYAQMATMSGVTTMNFCSPFRIPPTMKAQVIELRQILQEDEEGHIVALTERDLALFKEDIRECYLDIREYLTTPPVLTNTDGDLLEIHVMTFDIESTQDAVDALAPLAQGVSAEELLRDAEYDAAGTLMKVEFPWLKKGNAKLKTWGNTVLGRIQLSGRSLMAEANSGKRARKLRKEIEKRLGPDGAVHRSTRVKSHEELLDMATDKRAMGQALDSGEEEELLQNPEMRKKAQEFLQKEFDAWVDKKLPILGGKTPKQAVKDPDGKEIVESLLLSFERDAGQKFPGVFRPDISAVRKRLNLPSNKPI